MVYEMKTDVFDKLGTLEVAKVIKDDPWAASALSKLQAYTENDLVDNFTYTYSLNNKGEILLLLEEK